MKKAIITLLTATLCVLAFGQGRQINVAGTVMDVEGRELIGVTVYVKTNQSVGTSSDVDGKFRLNNIPSGSVLVFSYLGYETMEIEYNDSREREKIVMNEVANEFEEIVVVGQGTQRKVSVVGAIATVNVETLQVPAVSVSNMLGGNVPGIISVTRSGQPGNNFSEFWVRGISTFGASQSALILIDGIEGNLDDVDPSDIESFSVLKDASATAVYGVRGANGVVIITTKRGKAGKLNIRLKSNVSYSYSPRMPDYVDSYTYATLANEARAVRGEELLYTPTELQIFRSGLDPDLYPNVNWRDAILKDFVIYNQENLSVSGGGANARYYLSLGVLNQGTIFKKDESIAENKAKKYDYNKYNFRANIDANLTSSTTLSLSLDVVNIKYANPGKGDYEVADYIWKAQANMPPVRVPLVYSNGYLPAVGKDADEMSPYVRMNYTGYTNTEKINSRVNVGLNQDLDFVTDGLKVGGIVAVTSESSSFFSREKKPDLYQAIGRSWNGALQTQRTVEKTELETQQWSHTFREYYFEGRALYDRVFDDLHRVGGLVLWYRKEQVYTGWGNSNINAIPERYQAVSGRFTYSYDDTYMIEGNIGYTGTENFAKNMRYGLFPAIAGGWVPTQYQWVKENVPFFNFFKLRASWGKVGNDRLLDENGDKVRFPFLSVVEYGGGGGVWGGSSIVDTRIGANNLKWETTTKTDIGIETRFWDQKIRIEADYFRSKTKDIYQQRANIPDEAGLSVLPYTNIGSMKSWGADGTIAYTERIRDNMFLTFRGNFTYANNEVLYWEQSGVNYPYQSYSGVPYGVQRGLIALGLFKDEDDIKSSPVQTFSNKVLPGDIKYKDVNGDGIIDSDDIVPFNYSNVPRIQYGFATEFSWKNLTVSAFFEGVSKVQYFFGGSGYYPFAGGQNGNVLTIVANQNNRWTPASYSGTTATENPNARFPRMTYGENANNDRNSTFWIADGRYLRLKNVQMSYTWRAKGMRKIGMESVMFSFIGENLAVWDKIKLWDPSQASKNGAVYPLQRMFTLQVDINF